MHVAWFCAYRLSVWLEQQCSLRGFAFRSRLAAIATFRTHLVCERVLGQKNSIELKARLLRTDADDLDPDSSIFAPRVRRDRNPFAVFLQVHLVPGSESLVVGARVSIEIPRRHSVEF